MDPTVNVSPGFFVDVTLITLTLSVKVGEVHVTAILSPLLLFGRYSLDSLKLLGFLHLLT